MRCIARLALLSTFLGLPAASSAGPESQAFPHGTISLVAENTWIQPGHDFTLALHFSLDNGWHTYWVNPGDSGQPARVTWELPPGITSDPMQWPAPEQLGTPAIVDYGYKREVTLLVPMHASTDVITDRAVTITAKISVLVCKEVCIPGKTQVTLSVPGKKQAPPRGEAQQALFDQARARLPKQLPADWKFTAKDQGDSFILSAAVGKRVTRAYFYPLEESQIKNVPEQPITPKPGGFQVELRKSDQLTKTVPRLRGVLQLDDGGAYLVDAVVARSGSAKSTARPAG